LAVDLLFELLKSSLAAGQRVRIPSFGTFQAVHRQPMTTMLAGKLRTVPERVVVTFRPDPALVSKLSTQCPTDEDGPSTRSATSSSSVP
jgi:nucleoid DNA-binding protein